MTLARVLVCTLAIALPGCERREPPAPRAQSAGTQAADAEGPRGTAKISGRATFDGNPPAARAVSMSADPYCARANQSTPPSASPRLGPTGGLADVFVYVSKGIAARYAPPDVPVTLDQRSCAYAPVVIGLQTGQPLEIRNSDDTLHNVHALSKAGEGFNIGMPRKGMTAVRKFTAPEVLVRIKCDVHPWMAAYAGVVEHPFFAVTDADGAYELAGLPAGTYTVSALHYDLGGHVEEVTVTEGGSAAADFRFSD